jgi:hypothetical protein
MHPEYETRSEPYTDVMHLAPINAWYRRTFGEVDVLFISKNSQLIGSQLAVPFKPQPLRFLATRAAVFT